MSGSPDVPVLHRDLNAGYIYVHRKLFERKWWFMKLNLINHQQNWNTCSPQMSHTSLHTLVYMLCIFNTSEAISLHPATSCSFREATQVRLGWTCVVASVLQDETHWIPCLCQPQSLWSRQAVWGPNSAAQNQIHSPTASTSHPGEEAHWHSNCTVKVLQ